MKANHENPLHRALVPALLGAFLAGAAIAAVAVPRFSTSPGGAVAAQGAVSPPISVSAPAGPGLEFQGAEDCRDDQVVEPGEYESIQRTGSGSATWVIVPESNDRIAPAPLYVLSVEGFMGSTSELDLLRPVFERLEGVVLLTALQSNDDEMASLIAEVARDFCVDAQRVVTSSVPSLSVQRSPGPERMVASRRGFARDTAV